MAESTEETYELVAVNALPSFDPRVKVSDWLFSRSNAQLVVSFMYRGRHFISSAYFAGSVLRYATLLTPAGIGSWLAVASLVLQLLGSLKVLFASRVMFLRVIMQCFQSSYFLTCGALWSITLAIYVGDWRIAMIPTICIDFFNANGTDAHFFDLRQLVIVAFFSTFFLASVAVICMLDVVDSVHNHVMVPTRYRSLTTRELIVNTSAILVVLSGRIVFQRHQVLKLRRRRGIHSSGHLTNGVLCIAYRCRLRMQRVSPENEPPARVLSAHNSNSPRKSLTSSSRLRPPPLLSKNHLQLQYVTQGEQFRSGDVLWRLDLAAHPWLVRLVNGCGIAGWLLTLVAFTLPHMPSLTVASTVASSLFCGVYASQHHRRLLCKLYTSFDFVFLTLKVAIIHLCIADLCLWQSTRTWCIWTHFWWIHWLLVTDALTPLARQQLHFQAIYAVPVLMEFVFVQVAIAVDVLWIEYMGFQDRAYLRKTVFGREVAFYIVPMLLSRNFSVIVWCLRLVWRIRQSRLSGTGEELVLILGDVEFDAFHTSRRKLTLVAPNPPRETQAPQPSR